MQDTEIEDEDFYSVFVNFAYKSYSGKEVLKGLCMRVKKGTIYSLLGPSGCGKTTLLAALVGRIKLDSGRINMGACSKSDIGYMPQEISLHKEFTIGEHIVYYGRLYCMCYEDIYQQAEKLIKFLELPSMNHIINKMSGGEQRRMSLCLALLHNPKLLILDEPTVGLDILLANSIWENLLHMSEKDGKTIIITTHYIEEARHSNTIGLMRHGVILAENSPSQLLEELGSETLEDAFLKLCMAHDNGNIHSEEERQVTGKKQRSHFTKTRSLNLNRTRAYMLKNIYWMKRNIPMMFFTLALPIVQCILISVCIGESPTGLRIAVVVDEFSQNPIDCLNTKLGKVNCSDGDGPPFSCYLLQKMFKKSLQIASYGTIEAAKRSVRKNEEWAVVYFNGNYTLALRERIKNAFADDKVLNQSVIQVWMDSTNIIVSDHLKFYLAQSLLEFVNEVKTECKWSHKVALPIKYEKPVFGVMDTNFRQFMTPANTVLFEFYLPMMFTTGSLLMEKTSGLLGRSLATGLTVVEMGLGHVVLQYIVLIIQTLFVWIVFFVMFDNPFIGNFASCMALLLLVGTCGMFYGFFIVALCNSFTTAAYVAMGGYFPLFILSGAIWPLEGMHGALRSLALVLPITTSVEGFRALSIRAWPFSHPVVYTSLVALFGWILIFTMFTAALIKYKGLGA